MAAKLYRPSLTSAVHRVVQGGDRTVRSGRDKRAIAKASKYGQFLARSSWAQAEFDFLSMFYSEGLQVPYPVQIQGVEVLIEWLGDESGTSYPRLADVVLSPSLADSLFDQIVDSLLRMARLGYAHGDLSAFNILVKDDKAFLIDFPQVVDNARNPEGAAILERDCFNICEFFERRGHPKMEADALFAECMTAAWS